MNRRKLLKILGISSFGAAILPLINLRTKRVRVGDIGDIQVFIGPPNPNYRSYIFDRCKCSWYETYFYLRNNEVFLVVRNGAKRLSERITIHEPEEAFVDNSGWKKIRNFRGEFYMSPSNKNYNQIKIEFEII